MARCPGAANLCCLFFHDNDNDSSTKTRPDTLGILAFDAAKTMCRLISLYNSLDHHEILHLRRHVIRSKSVSLFNSRDECFLLTLACAERLEDLNLAASTVARFATRCSSQSHASFEAVDARKLEFGTKDVERKIENMEKLVCATRSLHKSMELLTEMEASEKKMEKWRTVRANHGLNVKVESFNDKITFYRRQIAYFKQVSLWNQSFDKVIGLMARIVCIVYNRICYVFGNFITGNAIRRNQNKNAIRRRPIFENSACRIEHRELYKLNLCMFDQTEEALKKRAWSYANCCNTKKSVSTGVYRFHHVPRPKDGGDGARNNRVMRLAPATTVGGAGLSLRYANVILLVERCMRAPGAAIGDDARVALYDMLPRRLKVKLSGKLRGKWTEWEKLKEEKTAVATEWHEAAAEVMETLVPVAQDMVRWQTERNLEKQKFEMRPTVLLCQTLHYSDLEKVEEAIVEVLLGLSYMYWNQQKL